MSPVVHAAMPGAERSPRHTGRTYAVCRVWAHDIFVRPVIAVGERVILPVRVNCRNCWKRFREGKVRAAA